MLRFLALGPLEIVAQNRTETVRGILQAGLLLALLARADSLVLTESLVDELWGTTPPEGVENALQAHVSRLRRRLKELEPNAAAPRLITHPAGYRLAVTEDELDTMAFIRGIERLRRQTNDEPEATTRRVRDLLALWRGPAYSGSAGGRLSCAAAARCDEARLAALELLFDAELGAGRHRLILPELREVMVDYPYKERFRQQLIVALYRSGRQTDALDVYRELRYKLSEELGLEPSPAMRDYERAVLEQDPALNSHVAIPGHR